jgi:hypothetical protein
MDQREYPSTPLHENYVVDQAFYPMSIKENKSQNMEYLDKSSQHCSYNKSK